MRDTNISSLVTLMLSSALVSGQTTQPTAPQSPAATLADFRRGMDGIDPAVVSQILLANDQAGKDKIAQLQKLATALSLLRKAISEKFGSEATYLFESPPGVMLEKIEGAIATVTTPDGRTIHLRKIGTRWRIPVRQEDDNALEQHLAELQIMTEAVDSIAADTEAGRFDTPDEVLRAAQQELTRGRAVRRAAITATTEP